MYKKILLAVSPSIIIACNQPNKGWFSYFRIYGPEAPAFDGSWKPGDFEEVK